MADAETPLRLLLVLFRPELIAGPGCREIDLGYLAPFRIDERVASPRVPAGSCLAAALAPALHELFEIWVRQDPADRHLLDATLRRVLGLAIRERGSGCGDAAARAAADRREQIRPVLAYVDRHCRESITLEDVAEVVHVSPSRVRHVFKDVTGVGFKEYVTNVRLAEAKRLLLSTDLSVAEIARAVSYTNLHQFYRVFYRSFSMSPGSTAATTRRRGPARPTPRLCRPARPRPRWRGTRVTRRRGRPRRAARRGPGLAGPGPRCARQRRGTGITGHSNSFTGAEAIVSMPAAA